MCVVSFSRFSTLILLFSYDKAISFSHFFLKAANSIRKCIPTDRSVSENIFFFRSSILMLSNLPKLFGVSAIMLRSGVGTLVAVIYWVCMIFKC